MEAVFENDILTISLEGRIDSLNSEDLQKRLFDALLQYGAENVVIDANRLSYISSAGLRVLLKFRKKIKGFLKIVGVSDEVYDIFSITGFVDMFDIERKIRSVRIGDSVRINSALNGSIYQLSKDEIIKIYGRNVPLSEIKKERDYSRAAMISGIPTLIPYDVVESEYGYGIVFEKADAVSLTRLIRENSGNLNIYATWLARLMQEVHGTEIEPDRLPDIKDRYNKWIAEVSEGDRDSARIMSTLIESIPDSNNYVHGDMNLGKILVKDGELLLFDMAGSARGNAIFDLQNIYATLVGIENNTQGYCRKKYSLSAEVCHNFWDEFIYRYYKGDSAMVQKMNDIMRRYYILTEKVLNAVSDRYKKSAAALFENRRPS